MPMKAAAKQVSLLLMFVLFIACSASSVHYETYYNERYDYWVDYPDFLLPQGEASSQDGQRFTSVDGRIKMLVYYEYKYDFHLPDKHLPIEDAYQEDLGLIEDVLTKSLKGDHYIIEYQTDRLHADYVLLDGERYFNVRFEYPNTQKSRMQAVIAHVFSSFKVEAHELSGSGHNDIVWAGDSAGSFPAFLEGFFTENYWGKNFNRLLHSNDTRLAIYIDPDMDVRRYYAPGTVTKLASREEGFAFTQEVDFASLAVMPGEIEFEFISAEVGPCGLDFNHPGRVYYQRLTMVPEAIVNSETFATEAVMLVYPNADIMAAYLANAYSSPRGFYFVQTPSGWKLAFVDDSLCGA